MTKEKITFADGFSARINNIEVSHTYAGLICGKPAPITEGWLKANAEIETKRWGQRSWHAAPNPTEQGWGHKHKVFLWLDSELIPNGDGCFCGSHALVALTLALDYSKPLPEQIESVIGHLKWTDIAENWDF